MGTVGGGVYEIIERQKEEMPFKIGAALEVVKVLVRNKGKIWRTGYLPKS